MQNKFTNEERLALFSRELEAFNNGQLDEVSPGTIGYMGFMLFYSDRIEFLKPFHEVILQRTKDKNKSECLYLGAMIEAAQLIYDNPEVDFRDQIQAIDDTLITYVDQVLCGFKSNPEGWENVRQYCLKTGAHLFNQNTVDDLLQVASLASHADYTQRVFRMFNAPSLEHTLVNRYGIRIVAIPKQAVNSYEN